MKSYLDLMSDVLLNGEYHDDRTKVTTRSVFGRQWRHNMKDGFPLLTTKKVSLRWVFEELRWFLSGSTDVKDLQKEGVTIWDEWATKEQCAKFGREEGDMGPIYGGLWRDFGGTNDAQGIGEDQISNLLFDIQNSPQSRRLIVSGWSPQESKLVTLPPCHTLWQIKCHGDTEMSLSLYCRSIDIFLGMPYNIASYGLLLEMLAKVTNRKARDLVFSFGDLHLYNNHLDQAREQLSRSPNPLPTIEINSKGSNSPLQDLLDIRWSDIKLSNYNPQSKIQADVAI